MAENKIIDLERLKEYGQKTHAKEVNEAYLVHGLAGMYDYTFAYVDALYDDSWGNDGSWNASLSEHTVVFDGTPYTVQHKVPSPADADYADGVGGYLGDVNLVEFPFYIMLSSDAAGTVWFYVSAAPGNHTVKIDNANLGTVTVDPSCSAYVGSGDLRLPACCADIMDKNVTALEITFDGVDYTLEPLYESDSTYEDWYFGNMHMYDSSYPDTGEPFYCDMYVFHNPGSEGFNFTVYAGNGEHTVSYKAIKPIVDTVLPDVYVHRTNPKTSGTLTHNGGFYNPLDHNPNSYGSNAVSLGAGSSAGGLNSFAAGYGSRADANNAIAMGYGAKATGSSSIAIGNINSRATANNATAIGCGSLASASAAIAFTNSAARGTASVAIGGGEAVGSHSAAIGIYTKAKGNFQQARGLCNVEDTENKYADILGGGTVKNDPSDPTILIVDTRKNIEATTKTGDKKMHGDVYVGANDDSSGGQKLIRPSEIGIPTYDATKTYAVNVTVYEPNTDKFYKCKTAITEAAGAFDSTKWTEIKFGDGYLTRDNPTGTGALSLNRKGTVGENSVAVGTECQATGSNAFAGGSKSKAVGNTSFAFGSSCTANGNLSFAFGNQAVAGISGTDSTKMITIGASAKADADSSIAIGAGAKAGVNDDATAKRGGGGSVAIGSNAAATYTYSVAIGASSKSAAASSVAIGHSALANQNHAVAIGRYSYAHNHKSTALGWYASAVSPGQLARGKANIEDTAGNYADILGWGDVTEVSGSDDVVVRKNIEATTVAGDKKLKGDVYVHCEDDSSKGIRLSTPDVLAAYFDATAAYTAGSYVTNKDDGCLYKAKADITAGAWDASKWDKITVAQAIATGSAASDEVSEINLDGRALDVIDEGEFYAASTTVEDALQALPGITCAAFDKAKVYNVGDFVIKDGALYKANAAHATGEVFIPTKWDKTTIVENFGSGEYATKEDVDNAFDDIFGL